MDETGQEAFITRIRSALAHAADVRRSAGDCCTAEFTDETGAILDRIECRSAADRQQLLDRLIEMAQPINLNIIVLKDETSVTAAIADLVKNKNPECIRFFHSRKTGVTEKRTTLTSNLKAIGDGI